MSAKILSAILMVLVVSASVNTAAEEKTIVVPRGDDDSTFTITREAEKRIPLPPKEPERRAATRSAERVASANAARVCKPASAWLPLARKGEIKNPTVLAARVEESLKKDPEGNRRIRGANVTPNQLLRGMQVSSPGAVSGIHALPIYLRSLIPGEMPEGQIPMSRVKYLRNKDCSESYVLDTTKGYTRSARKGEVGWYDPNTNRMGLAGDCSNGPLKPTLGPKATPSPRAQVTPAPQATAPNACMRERFYARHRIWERQAAEVSGVRALMQEEASRGTIGGPNQETVSSKYGATFMDLEEAGKLSDISASRTIEMLVTYRDGRPPKKTSHSILSGDGKIYLPPISTVELVTFMPAREEQSLYQYAPVYETGRRVMRLYPQEILEDCNNRRVHWIAE